MQMHSTVFFGNKLYEAVDFEIMLHDAPWARKTKNVKKPPWKKDKHLENEKCHLWSKYFY